MRGIRTSKPQDILSPGISPSQTIPLPKLSFPPPPSAYLQYRAIKIDRSGIQVNGSFQRTLRTVSRLLLDLGLGSEPHVVGRLGLRVWVSASFHIFALTAGDIS